MKIAIFMDPIAKLKPKYDTTLEILEYANKLGWYAVFFTQATLICHNDNVYAQVSSINFKKGQPRNIENIINHGETALINFDIILIRKDPPFNMEYIYATYALELVEKHGVLVINKPQSIRDMNEKFSIMKFPNCCPPTIITNNIQALRNFWQLHKQIIYKPLDTMGGKSIFYVDETGKNLSVILEVMATKHTIMAQKYIADINHTGDKRIFIINGEPIPYGLARLPQPGELRGNITAGASGKVVELTANDYKLCKNIAPILYDMGLYFVGIDVIGNYLTEINITSPTCIIEITNEMPELDIINKYLLELAKHKSSAPPLS